MGWYYDLVEEAVKPNNANKTALSKHNIEILYRYFQQVDHLFLIAPLTNNDSRRRAELRETYKDLFVFETAESHEETHRKGVDQRDLLKRSARAYPAFITADSNIWLTIKKNTEANLALSPEESAILDSVSRPPTGADRIYPLFINGRPGSGKSTILQYLFAEQLYCHLRKSRDERLAHLKRSWNN